jgi:hypothetical protein
MRGVIRGHLKRTECTLSHFWEQGVIVGRMEWSGLVGKKGIWHCGEVLRVELPGCSRYLSSLQPLHATRNCGNGL